MVNTKPKPKPSVHQGFDQREARMGVRHEPDQLLDLKT